MLLAGMLSGCAGILGRRRAEIRPLQKVSEDLHSIKMAGINCFRWAKLLKRWSGRPGSNRRRPAWENRKPLQIQYLCIYGIHPDHRKPPSFNKFREIAA